MIRNLIFLAVAFFVGCASTDRISTVSIPEDGAETDYAEFLPRLRTLAWRATEAFYRDKWDELDDSVQALDRGVKVLQKSKNVPARVQPDLVKHCQALESECEKVRQAARERSVSAASDHLQKIHMMIRELRSEP